MPDINIYTLAIISFSQALSYNSFNYGMIKVCTDVARLAAVSQNVPVYSRS